MESMKGLLGLGGKSESQEADWSFRNPDKATEDETRRKIIQAARKKGREGVLSVPEVSQGGKAGERDTGKIGKEDAAAILFRKGKNKFETVEQDIKEIQSILDQEMERIEQEAKQAIEKERESGEIKKVESKAEETFWNEEKNFEKKKEKVEKDLGEIQEQTDPAMSFFKLAETITDSKARKRSIKEYRSRISKIEQYKIAADLQIEEEDVEKLLSDIEEILGSEKIQEKEPQALAQEVREAIKSYSQDKSPVERLDFISAD
jgi:hypothetical protein